MKKIETVKTYKPLFIYNDYDENFIPLKSLDELKTMKEIIYPYYDECFSISFEYNNKIFDIGYDFETNKVFIDIDSVYENIEDYKQTDNILSKKELPNEEIENIKKDIDELKNNKKLLKELYDNVGYVLLRYLYHHNSEFGWDHDKIIDYIWILDELGLKKEAYEFSSSFY